MGMPLTSRCGLPPPPMPEYLEGILYIFRCENKQGETRRGKESMSLPNHGKHVPEETR